MAESTSLDTSTTDVLPTSVWLGRLLMHLRKPENLVTYLVFTAWMKFMGVSSQIPTITVG